MLIGAFALWAAALAQDLQVVIPGTATYEDARLMIQFADANDACNQGNRSACGDRDSAVASLRAHNWCPGEKWHPCGASDRPIEEPALKPVTAPEMGSYKKRWEKSVRDAAQAEYVKACGFRSSNWWLQIEGVAQTGMTRDPRYARFSAAQRKAVRDWKEGVREAEFAFLGRDMKACRTLIGWPYLTQLDRIAYPVLR